MRKFLRPEITVLDDGKFGGLAVFRTAADRVVARDFEFLGVRKQLGHKVEWLHGPMEWTHVLSRFGCWDDLGRADRGTGNPASARDFVDLLEGSGRRSNCNAAETSGSQIMKNNQSNK